MSAPPAIRLFTMFMVIKILDFSELEQRPRLGQETVKDTVKTLFFALWWEFKSFIGPWFLHGPPYMLSFVGMIFFTMKTSDWVVS